MNKLKINHAKTIIPNRALPCCMSRAQISGFLLGRKVACNPLDANHQQGSELINCAILELLFWFGSTLLSIIEINHILKSHKRL